MIKVFFVVFVALWCASLGRGQGRSDLVKDNFPTNSDLNLNRIVSFREAIDEFMKCTTAVDYNGRKCYEILKETGYHMIDFIVSEKECRPPLCTRAEGDLADLFMKDFSKKHPALYKKLIDEIVNRPMRRMNDYPY